MAKDLGKEKQHAHKLIEQLPPHQLSAVVGLLEAMIDPVGRKLASAPTDDETETEEERRAVEQSREWLPQRGGKGIPHEEVLRDFGLTTRRFSPRSAWQERLSGPMRPAPTCAASTARPLS